MDPQHRYWPTADLIRRLCAVLDVAHNTVSWLASDGYTDVETPQNNVRPEKVIAESALLLLAASTANQDPSIRDRISAVAEQLAPHARSDRMLLGICVEPSLAWEFAQGHVILKRLGYPDARFDSALKQISRSQARRGRERPPHRALEQIWAARGLNMPAQAHSNRRATPPSLVRQCVLLAGMDLLSASREDVYAFTHALMYVTDFNIHPWHLPRKRSLVLADAEAALSRCLDEQDYDLGGEVLLTWPLTGRRWSAAAVFGFRVLAHVEDQAGFLPSPGTRPERLAGLQGEARTTYLLATAYHTVYVMGLLCAVALQPGRAPPIAIKRDNSTSGVASVLIEKLDEDGRTPHWRCELDEIPEAARDALAGMLLMIGLRRCVTRRDFAQLREFLLIGDRAGLTNTPSASQSAELLNRLALVSEDSAREPASRSSMPPAKTESQAS